MAIERDGDDAVGPGQARAPDLDVWRRDASRAAALCADADTLDSWAVMGSAARTGWPRDAARVGVLCAEVERLAALESVAVKHHDTCLGACGCGVCAWVKASRAASERADRETDPCPGSRRW